MYYVLSSRLCVLSFPYFSSFKSSTYMCFYITSLQVLFEHRAKWAWPKAQGPLYSRENSQRTWAGNLVIPLPHPQLITKKEPR